MSVFVTVFIYTFNLGKFQPVWKLIVPVVSKFGGDIMRGDDKGDIMKGLLTFKILAVISSHPDKFLLFSSWIIFSI
jgi:hypothetical protein